MHGWFHFGPWVHSIVEPLGGGMFRPYNAASTAAAALQGSIIVQILYFIGVMSCVFHLANGIWTMGITWGVWVTPASQRWANYVCAGFGVLLALVSLGALGGFLGVDVAKARKIEERMYEARTADGTVIPDEHKVWHESKEDAKEMAKATE
jgi:succinate dehydrogenase / fumarate reductase cytochrome b subunit